MTAFPKKGKRITTKKAKDLKIDKAESELVKLRSEGRCEVRIMLTWGQVFRCDKPAVHVMHLIGGNGRRGRGISALASHKLHGCATHHREIDGGIGGKKLRRVGGMVPLWTDPYERVQ